MLVCILKILLKTHGPLIFMESKIVIHCLFIRVGVWVLAWHDPHVEFGGQLVGTGPLLSLCMSR